MISQKLPEVKRRVNTVSSLEQALLILLLINNTNLAYLVWSNPLDMLDFAQETSIRFRKNFKDNCFIKNGFLSLNILDT